MFGSENWLLERYHSNENKCYFLEFSFLAGVIQDDIWVYGVDKFVCHYAKSPVTWVFVSKPL